MAAASRDPEGRGHPAALWEPESKVPGEIPCCKKCQRLREENTKILLQEWKESIALNQKV